MRLSIIIPAYNEEQRIGKTLDNYMEFFKKRYKIFEIIVVLNGCKDNTLRVVKSKQKEHKEIIYLDFKKAGKGFAISEGFKNALERKNDLIGFVDADGATPPEAFYDLVLKINGFDGVIANRWDKRSVIKTRQPLLRRIMSRGFNFLVRTILMLNFRDTQCGAKLFKRKCVEGVVNDLGKAQWAFDIEMLYKMKRLGFKIKDVPTIWKDQKDSKLNVTKVPLQMFSSIIRIRVFYSPFRKFIKLYDNLPERFKIHKT